MEFDIKQGQKFSCLMLARKSKSNKFSSFGDFENLVLCTLLLSIYVIKVRQLAYKFYFSAPGIFFSSDIGSLCAQLGRHSLSW